MELGLWSSVLIVIGFSFLVVFLDEFVVKPLRQKRWARRAASGDEQARQLLEMARSAKVVDD
jgi:hypothetical protein